MLALFASLALVFVVLVATELSTKHHSHHAEYSRKVIHILVGSFAAFWPLYLSWDEIRYISIALLVGVGVSKTLNIFSAIHNVPRPTIGEISFAAAIGILTFVTREPWLYAVCLLQMSLADGMAALIGVRYGRNNRYRVFGAHKSVAGTLAFVITSLGVLFVGMLFAKSPTSWWLLVVAALIAAGTENIAVYGLDNIFLPVITALVISHL